MSLYYDEALVRGFGNPAPNVSSNNSLVMGICVHSTIAERFVESKSKKGMSMVSVNSFLAMSKCL